MADPKAADAVDAVYEEVILRHHRQPGHRAPLARTTHRGQGVNPLCGDEIQLSLQVEEGRIKALCFHDKSCAICRASASIMGDAVSGKSLTVVRQTAEAVIAETENATSPAAQQATGDVAAIVAVRRLPARINCALLPWKTLLKCLGPTGGGPGC
jgi:nitrogen fixation NifU-like protein